MRTVPFGPTAVPVSAIGLGTNNLGWRLDRQASVRLVHAAADLGVTFLDTADIYGEGRSEAFIGEALATVGRDRYFIATKVGLPWEDGSLPGGLHPSYIRSSVEASLSRLCTDRIDLLQLHRPDPAVPIEATLEALHELVGDGKIRFVGCSNFMVWELVEWVLCAEQHDLPRMTAIQPEYSMLVRDAETELLHACAKFNIHVLPYRPLAQGFLTGKYRPNGDIPANSRLSEREDVRDKRLTESNFRVLAAVESVATDLDATPSQVAIAWLLTRAQVGPVIAGASSESQLAENAGAAGLVLESDHLESLGRELPDIPGGAVGALWNRSPQSMGL